MARRTSPTDIVKAGGGSMSSRPEAESRDLAAVSEEQRRRWPNTLKRQELVRKLLRGDLRAPLPKRMVDEGADYFRVDSTPKYHRSRDVINSFAKRWPDLVRYHPVGTGPASNSTKIEQGVTAIMRSDQRGVGWPKDAVMDLGVNEGVAAVIIQPSMSFWQQIPSSMRTDPEKPDSAILDEYQRDSKGRPADHAYYQESSRRKFAPDKTESRKAFDRKVDWLKARATPILQRPISIEQGLPIFGSSGRIEAFIVSSQFAVTQLARERFAWWDATKSILSGYGGAPGSGVATIQPDATETKILHELWRYGCGVDDGHPCVWYQVEKCDTYRVDGDGNQGPTRICFGCEYGKTTLPVVWSPFLQWAGAPNPDDRCIPLPWSYMRNDLAIDAVATGVAVSWWRTGFPTWHAKPDPTSASIPDPGAEDSEPDPIVIEPLTIVRSSDTLTQIGGNSVSSDGTTFLAFLKGENAETAPSLGGDGAGSSAIAQATANRFGKDELAQVENAYLKMYAESAGHVAEFAAGIGKKHGPIAIFEQVDTPVASYTERASRERSVLTIKPEWFGSPGNFDLDAQMPIRPGDNLALTQQLADLHDRAIIDMQAVHEWGLGITDSESMVARVEAEKIRNEPAGRARILALVAQIQGDEEEAQQAKLKAAQLLSEALGLPTNLGQLPPASPEAQAAMVMQQRQGQQQGIGPGVDPNAGMDPMQGGGMTGISTPNLAASSLGGKVASALATGPQQNAAQIGTALPMGA